MSRAALVGEPGRAPRVGDREPARPAAGQVLVEVQAAPITPLDLLCATGTSYFGVPVTPYVPGVQGVGRVSALGPDGDPGSVATVGSLVWFPTTAGMAPGDGSMARFAVATASDLVVVPDGVTPVQAAALGLSAVAAWMALTWRGGLAPGESVLVLGAGGVVGSAAIQLARLAGAGRVVAVTRGSAAVERALELGADAAVDLGTRPAVDDVAGRIAEATGGVDLVLDPVFGVPAAAAARALRPGGRWVNLGDCAGTTCPVESATLRSRSLQLLGYTNAALTADQRGRALSVVLGHAARGRLRVRHQAVSLDEVESAWQRQGAGQAPGRIVLTP